MRQEVNSHMKSSICPKDDVFVSLLGCLFRSHPIICAALLAALLTQIPVRVKILVSLTAKMGPAEAKDQECNPGVSLCSEEVRGKGRGLDLLSPRSAGAQSWSQFPLGRTERFEGEAGWCSAVLTASAIQCASGFQYCLRVSVTLSPQFVLMLNSGIIKAVPLIQKKQAMRATLRLHACVYTHGRVLHVSDACGFDTPEHLFFPDGTADPELFGAQNHAGFSDMWECRLKATHSLGSGRRGLLTHGRAILHSWQSSEGTGDWIP